VGSTRRPFSTPVEPTLEDDACGQECPLVRQIFIISNVMMRLGDKLSAPIGLTSSRWLLLCAIGRIGEEASVKALSADAMLSAQNVSRMLASMEEEGLVERFTRPGHGRMVFVRLTSDGAETLEKTHELAKRFEERFLKGVSGESAEALSAELQRLLDNLESFEAELEREQQPAGTTP